MARSKAPLYNAGETYYLSHKAGVPARIVIEMVYKKSGSKEWMYAIYSEANGGNIAYVPESMLTQRISKHNSPVYKNQIIIDRINNGYRFAGNYNRDTAIGKGKHFALDSNIDSVLLHPALDSNGELVCDQYGIWIRWSHVISGNGLNESVIKIK